MMKNESFKNPPGKGSPVAKSEADSSTREFWKAGKSILIFILAFLYLVPVIVLFLTSFKTQIQIMEKGFGWFFMPTLMNYSNVLLEQGFLRYMTNSLIVGLASTFVTLIIGGFASYALVRFNFFGKGTISFGTLLLRMIPPAVLVVPIYVLWSYFGLADTLLGLVIIYVGLNLPFTIWVLISFIADVPVELEEAAVVDFPALHEVQRLRVGVVEALDLALLGSDRAALRAQTRRLARSLDQALTDVRTPAVT